MDGRGAGIQPSIGRVHSAAPPRRARGRCTVSAVDARAHMTKARKASGSGGLAAAVRAVMQVEAAAVRRRTRRRSC